MSDSSGCFGISKDPRLRLIGSTAAMDAGFEMSSLFHRLVGYAEMLHMHTLRVVEAEAPKTVLRQVVCFRPREPA